MSKRKIRRRNPGPLLAAALARHAYGTAAARVLRNPRRPRVSISGRRQKLSRAARSKYPFGASSALRRRMVRIDPRKRKKLLRRAGFRVNPAGRFVSLVGVKSKRVYIVFNMARWTMADLKRAARSLARKHREPIAPKPFRAGR